MKASELRDLSKTELSKKEDELREDILRLRFKLSTGELEDTSKIRVARKDIARIKTILNRRNGEQ
ncbi:MAG: 50S ribosomal protein L29 [Deferribacteraceae bacterium]|nr:50S ribosomal protein L29 [Deferribacteraceae bacterium]